MKRTMIAALVFGLLLPPAAAQNVPYLAGGVGEEEQLAMKQRAGEFNLRLLFAEKGSGHYRVAVRVIVLASGGQTLLDVSDAGPMFYARLPPGRYQVVAEADGQRQTRAVTVGAAQATQAFFYFGGQHEPVHAGTGVPSH